MTILAEKENEVNVLLENEYCKGAKWVVYSTWKLNDVDSICCFKDYASVEACCASSGKSCKPILNVLRILNWEKYGPPFHFDEDLFYELLQKAPIAKHYFIGDLAAILKNGDFAPVLIRRRINHQEVASFNIYRIVCANSDMSDEVSAIELLDSHANYVDAVAAFDRVVKNLAVVTGSNDPDFTMVGILKNQEVNFDEDGWPVANCGVIIKSAYPFYDTGLKQKGYTIVDHRDFYLELLQPVLARFNFRKYRFEFFDSDFKKVSPGQKVPYISFIYYDSQQVNLKNALC